MTNREKLIQLMKETFPEIRIDEEEISVELQSCHFVYDDNCDKDYCNCCPVHEFWDKEYKENNDTIPAMKIVNDAIVTPPVFTIVETTANKLSGSDNN